MKKLTIIFITVFFVLLGVSVAWAPCGISGFVYCDVDKDGKFNGDDIPLPDVVILLNGAPVATTNSVGMYSIESHELCDGRELSLDVTTFPDGYDNYEFINPLENVVSYEKVYVSSGSIYLLTDLIVFSQQDWAVYSDTDGDTIPDSADNCPNNCNTQQLDADNDGIGDVCDPDDGCISCGKGPVCEVEC